LKNTHARLREEKSSPASPANGPITVNAPADASAEAGKTHARDASREHRDAAGRFRRGNGSDATHRGASPAPNGKSAARANGHGAAAQTAGPAASDDERGASVQPAAGAAAAGADRQSCAEVAGPCSSASDPGEAAEPARLPGEDVSQMAGAPDFADAVFARVNAVEVGAKLLDSKDEKTAQRALERFLEMRFVRATNSSDEPQPMIMDLQGQMDE